MLTDEEFLAFLNDKELDGSLEENLSKIIDDEMEKPEEEMDTELIEYCLDKLSELNSNATDANIKEGNGDSNDKHIKIKFRRVIAIVAAAVVLLVGTMSVSAVIFDVNIFDGMVELYNDYIRINFNYPVKYLDKQGNVVDKSNEITETEDGFESLNNDIKTTFGNALTDGISITYNDIKLKMIPLQEVSQISFLNDFFQPKASLKETEDCDKIIYKANNKTQYEYTLTAMGVKEDIRI